MKRKQRLVVYALLTCISFSAYLNIFGGDSHRLLGGSYDSGGCSTAKAHEESKPVVTTQVVATKPVAGVDEIPQPNSSDLHDSYLLFKSKLENNELEVLFHPPHQTFGRGGGGVQGTKHTSDQVIQQTMDLRQKRLKQRCKTVRTVIDTQMSLYNKSYNRGRFLVSFKNGVYTCAPFKVAMSNWKMMMFVLAGFLNTTDPLYTDLEKKNGQGIMKTELLIYRRKSTPRDRFRRYRELDFEQSKKIKISHLRSWFTYRHPFERLVSAYRSRVVESAFLRNKVHAARPSNWKRFPSKYPAIPTFTEFVDFVIHLLKPSSYRFAENHLVPIHEYCRVCNMNYNYLIAYEKINEEASFVLRKLNISDKAQFSPRDTAYQAKKAKNPAAQKSKSSTNKLVASYFKQLSPEQIWKLFTIYQLDFYLFGYTSEYMNT